jgi:signal transduction histidine kinase
MTISPIRDASGKIVGASKIARDISERKKIERALRESEERYRTLANALDTQVQFRTQELEKRNSQLRDLSGRLMESQDVERRHIARELHDSSGQTLAALGMQLARVNVDAMHNPAQLPKTIEDAEALVQHLSQEIRTTSYLLHPPMLDETGISSALSWYVQGLEERSGLKVRLSIPDNFGRLPSEMELLIFRLVQECLTNIHRHSGSTTAQIEITREEERIHMAVQDEGGGMSPQRLAEIQSHGTGVGIRGMSERVRQFHGDLVIESNGSGTRVYACLPLKPRHTSDQAILTKRWRELPSSRVPGNVCVESNNVVPTQLALREVERTHFSTLSLHRFLTANAFVSPCVIPHLPRNQYSMEGRLYRIPPNNNHDGWAI